MFRKCFLILYFGKGGKFVNTQTETDDKCFVIVTWLVKFAWRTIINVITFKSVTFYGYLWHSLLAVLATCLTVKLAKSADKTRKMNIVNIICHHWM